MAMRICLASIHPRMLSGQIESLVALGRELRALGHPVRVVSAFPEEMLYHDQRWALETGDARPLAPKVLRIGRIVRDLCLLAREADVVHLNLPTPAFAALGALVQGATGRPVVAGFEAQLAPAGTVLAGGHLFRAPRFFLPRLVVNNRLVARLAPYRCRQYVVGSEVQREELLRIGLKPDQVAVIPSPVDTAKLRRWPRAEARRRLGLPLDRKLIGYVGHYHPVKGAELLPGALRLVLDRVPEAMLVLAWSGLGDRRPVERAIRQAGVAEQVIQLGRVDVGLLLSAVDVLAAPYTLTIGQAAFPAVPLEAMCLGVPLVTSDLPLLRELTGGGAAGLLVPAGKVAPLGAALAAVLADPSCGAACGAAARRLYARAYDPRKLAERHAALYRAVVARQTAVLRPALSER